jgi:streptogramin lyase
MKKHSGTRVFLGCVFLLLAGGALRWINAGTILKQFGSFKSVNAVVPAGNQLWLATSGGVVRYDKTTGATKVYSAISDIPDMNLTAGVIDNTGDLWFGSASGFLTHCHPQTETFTSYNALATTVPSWQISCIVRSGGFLFIGTQKGIGVFNIGRQSFQNVTQFGSATSDSVSDIRVFGDTIAAVLPEGLVYTVVPDFQNAIFSDPGIWNFVPSSGVVGIVCQADSLLPSPRISAQIGSNLWQYAGGDNALLLNGALVNNFGSPVTSVAPLSDSQVAVGTRSSFWYLCNLKKQTFVQQMINGPEDSYTKGCAVDKNGVLWFVPYDMTNGIGQFDGKRWTSLTHDNTPSLPPMGGGPFICKNAIMVTSQNDIWVSSFGYGAKWFNRLTGTWSSYEDSHSPYYAQPSPIVRWDPDSANWWSFVSSTCEDSLGYIWLANNKAITGNFLDVRKPRDNSVWRSFNINPLGYGTNPLITGPIAANQNRAANTQYIYVGFNRQADYSGGGLLIMSYSSLANPLDTQTQMRVQLYEQQMSVTGFAVVNDTLVWVSAEDGIYRITRNDTSTITKISTVTSSAIFEAIAVGTNGKPVFCKDKDLYSYNDDDSSLTNLTRCGTLGTPVNWITLDKKTGVYWVAATSGLYRFDAGDTGATQTGAAAGTIDVYPNPVSRTYLRNQHPIRFARLSTKNPQVRIYDASGTLVRILAAANTSIINWDGTNTAGRVVIPGAYFFQANSQNEKSCKGKIFVIP